MELIYIFDALVIVITILLISSQIALECSNIVLACFAILGLITLGVINNPYWDISVIILLTISLLTFMIGLDVIIFNIKVSKTNYESPD